MAQFASWFARAEREVPLAEAVTLATIGLDATPDARTVLLKGHGLDGFRFFTNQGSAKGRQLDVHGAGALVAYWRELDRQVRARGRVSRLAPEESDAYFATRPRDSRLGAWASPQSEQLGSRAELEAARRGCALRRRRGAATGALGRLPAATRHGRVLAGAPRAPPRPVPLCARGRWLADRAPGALSAAQARAIPRANSISSSRSSKWSAARRPRFEVRTLTLCPNASSSASSARSTTACSSG